MGLNETVKHMREILGGICVDLEKANGGNKAASQRVRTGTIKLEKVAKKYRKESINAEKSGSMKRPAKKKAAAKKSSAKPAAKHAKAKAHAKKAPAKAAKVKARPKAKAVRNPAKRSAMMMKRPTAKLPVKKA